MMKEIQWPELMYYEILGLTSQDHGSEVPRDFDLSLEFVMRNMLAQEDIVFIRERFEQGLTEREIAQRHGLTIGHARGQINRAIRKLRHPSRSRYLIWGLSDAIKREVEHAEKAAYEEGYRNGYDVCREEYLFADEKRRERVERIRKELPYSVCELELSNRAKNVLQYAGIYRVETMLMLNKLQLRAVKRMGTKSADEIIAFAEKMGFALDEGIPIKYE